MPSQMTIDELIDGKILELGSINPGLGGRLIRYQEQCGFNDSYEPNKDQFYKALELLELLLPLCFGFLWDSITGDIQIQYNKPNDGSLVIIAFTEGSILVADSDDEYEFADLDSFRSAFLGGQDAKAI